MVTRLCPGMSLLILDPRTIGLSLTLTFCGRVNLAATNERALDKIKLEDLKQFATSEG